MIRTQIQLPDKLYHRLKRLAESEETSLANIIRKAGEYLIAARPDGGCDTGTWEAPRPRKLGISRAVPCSEWKLVANERPADDDLPMEKRPR
jgi:hypothetical protein